MNAVEGVILLAEDDPNDVLLIRRAFQRTQVANPLQVVRDGEEAVGYLSGQGPVAHPAQGGRRGGGGGGFLERTGPVRRPRAPSAACTDADGFEDAAQIRPGSA